MPSEKNDETPIGHVMGVKDKEYEDKNIRRYNENYRKESAQQDIIDVIYQEKDPIAASLKQRKQKGQTVTTVVR